MARKVFVSSDMAADERLIEVAEQNPKAALLWPWLLTSFDDWGRAEAQPKRLKATTFPMNDLVSADDIAEAIALYAKFGLLISYEVGGKSYMAIRPEKWSKYQTHIRKVRREGKDKMESNHPAPPQLESGGNGGPSEPPQPPGNPRGESRGPVPSPSPSLSRAKEHMCVPPSPETHDTDAADADKPDEPPPKSKRSAYPEDFERFWQAYPPNRRLRKKAAYKAWRSQQKRKPDERAPPDALIAAAGRYAEECARKGTEASYIMHPATFLGPSDPYEDYLQPGTDAQVAATFDDDPEAYMRRQREEWAAKFGDPDEGGERLAQG